MPRSRTEQPQDPWDLLATYRDRYEIADILGPIDSLEKSIQRRQLRSFALTRRIEELKRDLAGARRELRAVRAEIEGSRATGALLIEEILDRVKAETGEAWSPSPFRGFRVWRIHQRSIWGNQVVWTQPELESRCLRSIPGDDVPHSIAKCGPPACGIYAVKSLDMFPPEVAGTAIRDSVVGVVALSGKVVEHELGYRASRARVVAAAVNRGGRRRLFDRPTDISNLFSDPIAALEGTSEDENPADLRVQLESIQGEERIWI
jgi:hypothetical protein